MVGAGVKHINCLINARTGTHQQTQTYSYMCVLVFVYIFVCTLMYLKNNVLCVRYRLMYMEMSYIYIKWLNYTFYTT